ncbi:MAG: VWA domain-containing protein, partial [Chloroflexota bacterium]
MNQNYTDITVVLDRSGSMESIRGDIIGGYNQFVSDQKSISEKAQFTLVQFDDQYEMVHDGIDMGDVPTLTGETFVP